MNIKPADKVLKQIVATWLTASDYDVISRLAEANNVTIAAYMRAILVDVVAEENEKIKDFNYPPLSTNGYLG